MSAAQSDQYEILAARVALAQSQNPRVRDFAQHMIEDHSRTSEGLRQAATASGLQPPPPGISGDQSKWLATLQSLRGAEFDKTYAKQQILAHDEALSVERSYAGAGTDMTLRKAAQAAVPVIQRHLEMAQEIRERVGA